MEDQANITALLTRWNDGEQEALKELTPLVYARLHRLAEAAIREERAQHTLQPTAIINEAYLQLMDASVEWQDRGHFFALCARMMRRILVNHANARNAEKRGGGQLLMTYHESHVVDESEECDDILELDNAIKELAALDSRKADIVVLSYFGGLTYEQVATALEVSPATIKRDLRFSKAWIRNYLDPS